MTYSDLVDVTGEPGRFKVAVKIKARSVKKELCTGCGVCQQKCPWKADSEFNEGLVKRKAIYVPYAQAVPNIPVIDREVCAYFKKGTCRACEKFCPAHAIDFEQQDETVELEAGAIILAPGFDEFAAELKPEYGYGKFPNVVTSTQFERMLCASGPFQGHLQRPSDGKEPESIAFIQCVGSRDLSCNRPYCSSVCCTYAIKESIIAKEHAERVVPTIFYIDMRTHGKDFDQFRERAESEYGVRFIRCRVSEVQENAETGNLKIKYESEEGELLSEEFDLVVLSVGLTPSKLGVELASRLGIKLDDYGFARTEPFRPMETSRPGIFACGAFSGPKDIPETVIQASGAAGCAEAMLSPARGSMVAEKEFPPQTDITGQEPRIGAFICHCGINIGGYVDVPRVVEYARTLSGVVYAEANLYTCSQDTQGLIKGKIKEYNLNRVVVAACTPRTHEPLFRETVREAGLNQYLFEMANIRDQCSWVHMQDKEAATEKAVDLIRMAVAKARLLKPLRQYSVKVTPVALVVGGGIAGLTAALNLADQRFQVHLVEKERELGGTARRIHYSISGEDVQERLAELIERASSHPLMYLHLGSEIEQVSGSVGNFITTVLNKEAGTREAISHGAAVIAIGGREYLPKEYLYGEDPRVVTLLELERKLAQGEGLDSVNNAVFIQCVGSRNNERPYCSRICCSDTVKNALKLKEVNPRANIYVLYRDMRTYGFNEDYYREARQKGILFIRYEADEPPVLEREADKLQVTVMDPILGEAVRIDADLLALATATLPPEDNSKVGQLFKVPVNANGFMLEAHVKLRPVDFATDGVFLCGLAHNPKTIDESMDQAVAAASRAASLLSHGTLTCEGTVATIDQLTCSGCKQCIRVCPYEAIFFVEEKGVAQVNEALCKACGTCAAACPSGACSLRGFEDEQIVAQIEALAEVR